MKPKEQNNKRRLYWFIAILCFIYAGVSLILFVYTSYFLYVRGQYAPPSFRNFTQTGNFTGAGFRPPVRTITTPFLGVFLFGSLISILAGISLINLLRTKEKKELKKDIIDSMVMPNEKIVIKELEKNNGTLTQSELVTNTGLSKVKVHRIIKRLESLGIVKKHAYGITNKIKLEKILYEE